MRFATNEESCQVNGFGNASDWPVDMTLSTLFWFRLKMARSAIAVALSVSSNPSKVERVARQPHHPYRASEKFRGNSVVLGYDQKGCRPTLCFRIRSKEVGEQLWRPQLR